MPTRWQNGIGRVIDAVAKGNNYNPQTGQYSNVARGLLARAGQVGATMLGGPLAGAAVGQAGNNWVNNGNPLDFSGNDTRLGQLVNAFAGNNNSGGPRRENFGVDTSLDVNDIAQQIGIQPSLQTGGEGRSAADRMATELQRIQDQINQQGIATMPAVAARGIGGQLSFGGGRYNNGVGAGTGFGAASYANDAWGDTASGFGVGGMSGGARDQAMSQYGPTGRKTRS